MRWIVLSVEEKCHVQTVVKQKLRVFQKQLFLKGNQVSLLL
jgi:hypothetical protein